MRHLIRLGQALSEWPVESQQAARRNAMVALTACAQRRAEREDVASYLADRAAGKAADAADEPVSAPRPGAVAHA